MQKYTAIALATAARISATGNGSAVDVSDYTGIAKFVLHASATEGASHTYNGKIQHSADGTTNWTDTGIAFTQVTNAAASLQAINFNVDGLKKHIRLVDTMAGSSPFVTRSATLIAQRAY
jgi:hypothetical protein